MRMFIENPKRSPPEKTSKSKKHKEVRTEPTHTFIIL